MPAAPNRPAAIISRLERLERSIAELRRDIKDVYNILQPQFQSNEVGGQYIIVDDKKITFKKEN